MVCGMSDWNPPPPPPPPPGPYGQQPGYGAGGAPKTEGLAVASLVLGIVGLVGCIVVAPVLALIFGQQAKSKISQNPMLAGAGMAQAGFVLGIVGLVLDVFYILYLTSR